MTPLLLVHIGAGTVAIVSGALALAVPKGERNHRLFGTVFFLSMLLMAVLGIYLAGFGPHPGAGGAPPRASVAVGILTLYLVATAWMTIKRGKKPIGPFDYAALVLVLGVMMALALFGLQSLHSVADRPNVIPYFVFASFAGFLAILDLKVILQRGVSGRPRVLRHLWRMCFALFFATSFFFVGQQKVMPVALHGSLFLLLPALAPLAVMIFWLIRLRFPNRIPAAQPEPASRAIQIGG